MKRVAESKLLVCVIAVGAYAVDDNQLQPDETSRDDSAAIRNKENGDRPPSSGMPEGKQRVISQESIEHLQQLRKKMPFGGESFGGEVRNGRVSLCTALSDEVRERNPEEKKTVVAAMDGEKALWEVLKQFLPGVIGVPDIFHILDRLWNAAHVFHAEASTAAKIRHRHLVVAVGC